MGMFQDIDRMVSVSNAQVDARKLEAFDKLRELCGFVENGTSTTVYLSQDDATRDWGIRVDKATYHGSTFIDAIEIAHKHVC